MFPGTRQEVTDGPAVWRAGPPVQQALLLLLAQQHSRPRVACSLLPRSRPRSLALEVTAGQVVRRVQELSNEIELTAGESAGELCVPFGGHGVPDLVRAGVEAIGDLDPDSAAVHGIRHSAGVPGALEPVDDAGDGAGGETRLRRQRAGGHTVAVLD